MGASRRGARIGIERDAEFGPAGCAPGGSRSCCSTATRDRSRRRGRSRSTGDDRAPSPRSVTDLHSRKTIAQLLGMSVAGLIAAHDEIASASGSFSTVDDYRAELARRGIDEQTSTMLCLT